jgi:hypothetical protein
MVFHRGKAGQTGHLVGPIAFPNGQLSWSPAHWQLELCPARHLSVFSLRSDRTGFRLSYVRLQFLWPTVSAFGILVTNDVSSNDGPSSVGTKSLVTTQNEAKRFIAV